MKYFIRTPDREHSQNDLTSIKRKAPNERCFFLISIYWFCLIKEIQIFRFGSCFCFFNTTSNISSEFISIIIQSTSNSCFYVLQIVWNGRRVHKCSIHISFDCSSRMDHCDTISCVVLNRESSVSVIRSSSYSNHSMSQPRWKSVCWICVSKCDCVLSSRWSVCWTKSWNRRETWTSCDRIIV